MTLGGGPLPANDYVAYIGEVQSASAVSGDPDTITYSIFLRNQIDPNQTLSLTNYKPELRLYKNVQVTAAKPGDPVWAMQTPSGLRVFLVEQLEFTENCQ